MTRMLDEDEKGTHNLRIRSESGVEQDREMTIISESGLYACILKSRRAEAQTFRKWVTAEVLPTIRKTGKYEAPAATTDLPRPRDPGSLRLLPVHRQDDRPDRQSGVPVGG